MFVIEFEIEIHQVVRNICPTCVIRDYCLGGTRLKNYKIWFYFNFISKETPNDGKLLHYIFGLLSLESDEVEQLCVFDLMVGVLSNDKKYDFVMI